MKSSSNPVTMGRPRAFDADAALEKAMLVFWEKGYEGASLSDLTQAMGINRPSLYAAFGNKEELFRKVLDRYGKGSAAYFTKALEQPTPRAVIEMLLFSTAEHLCDPATPRGCLVLQGALCGSDAGSGVRDEARCRRLQVHEMLRTRFERAKAEGNLSASVTPDDLARYVSILLNGLSIQATNGAGIEEMTGAIRIALQGLTV